jgi:hypothetical protein
MKKMMYMALVLTAVTPVAVLPGAEHRLNGSRAREAVVKAYDSNGNGQLDKDEWAQLLKGYDTNKNGKLDQDEKRAVAKAVAGKRERKVRADHAAGVATRQYERVHNVSYAPNTLTRRVKEGYRLLVIGYGDHDRYSGKGTPYPNNPKGGEVNGLQASMSAVEYTVANYPTTHVFAHGTSAGSAGAYALGFAFAQDEIDLTGVVMDSSITTPRRTPVIMAMAGSNSKIAPSEAVEILKRESKERWLGAPRDQIEKVGVMIDPDYPFHPEAAVRAGYKSTPMLIVVGTQDPFFGARAPTIPEAKAAGLGNVEWLFDGLRKAIDEQTCSPHKMVCLNTGHVPTVKQDGHPVHDEVDAFVRKVSSSRTSFPFEVKE